MKNMDKKEHIIGDEVLYDNFGKDFRPYNETYKIIEIDKKSGYLIGNDNTKPFHAHDYQLKEFIPGKMYIGLYRDEFLLDGDWAIGCKPYYNLDVMKDWKKEMDECNGVIECKIFQLVEL